MITAKNLHHGSATRLDFKTTATRLDFRTTALQYILYINDLLSFCNDVEIVMHADDTVLHTHGEKRKEVENVAKWLNDSFLSLNVGKTMYFSNKYKFRLTSA